MKYDPGIQEGNPGCSGRRNAGLQRSSHRHGESLRHRPGWGRLGGCTVGPRAVRRPSVHTFAAGPDGHFWSWTLSDSLLTQVGTVTRPKKQPVTNAVSSGGTIRFDRDGGAWFVTHGHGIMRIAFPDRFPGGRISEKDPLVEKYPGKMASPTELSSVCWRIAKATSGSVRRPAWIASVTGIYVGRNFSPVALERPSWRQTTVMSKTSLR